ncbi:type II toxin-antitoxin system RelE/ParE family toxin [Phenylobacterium sp.]|uniref:type II toxin-antitoxin system RelE/ParE family toxin n=1 Tax=Phenylobacterium sp. TaxID=1871053 RepID=UPI00345B7B6F
MTLILYVYYSGHMFEVRQTPTFRDWLIRLRDLRARTQIIRRIDRAEAGNLGDVAPIGEGVFEMRIHQGPGYRVYFIQRGKTLILLLCGGDKSSQRTDIRRALQMARDT